MPVPIFTPIIFQRYTFNLQQPEDIMMSRRYHDVTKYVLLNDVIFCELYLLHILLNPHAGVVFKLVARIKDSPN